MASNYPPGVIGTEPEIVGEPEILEQFLIIVSGDGPMTGSQSWMEIVDEKRLSYYIDSADFLPVAVESIFVLRDGKLVKCEFGDVQRRPYPDPENESSIVYADSPLYANGELVGTIQLTDH